MAHRKRTLRAVNRCWKPHARVQTNRCGDSDPVHAGFRTFEWKAERTTDGEWHLAELSEIGAHEGRKPFDLAGLNNWRAMKARWAQEEHDRDRWHDEPDVKDALARYNAEVDPEKKEDLRKEWVEIGKAARIRLGIG